MQNPALGLCYQYLTRLVTIVSDTEIETIDLVFRIELGEEYLSIVSMQFGHENGQVFVIPVDHDSFIPFFQPIDTVTIASDTEIGTIDLGFIVDLGVSFLPLKVQDERRVKKSTKHRTKRAGKHSTKRRA